MRYGYDRPPWRQRVWWLDGIGLALVLPLVLSAVRGELPSSAAAYLLEVVAALIAWGLAGRVRELWVRER